MNAPASFGLWIKQRRRALDLTQQDLAQRVGCSISAIRKIEADERRPSRQIAGLLADCLEIAQEERAVFIKVARGERRLERLAGVSAASGLSAEAEGYYRESLALYRQMGHQRGIADLLHNMGYVTYHQGDYRQAAALFGESLELERQQGNRRGIAECLTGLAAVFSAQGDPQCAARLFAAAGGLLASLGAVLEPTDQLEFERSLAETRTRLDPADFDSAWDSGKALSMEQAIEYALELKL